MKAVHTLANDDLHNGRKAMENEVIHAMFAPVVTKKEDAARMVQDLLGGDKAKHDIAIKQLNLALRAPFDALHGNENEIVSRHKTITNTVLPVQPRQIAILTSMVDTKDLDMGWMQWMTQDSVTGALAVTITDVLNIAEFLDVDDETSDPLLSPVMAGIYSELRPKWNKRGVRIARSILENDPMQSINMIVIALRFKAIAKMNRDMYTMTQAGITAAQAAGYTTAYISGILRTINRARIALFNRLSAKPGGQEFSMDSNLVLVANEIHRDLIEPLFRPTNNIPFGTQQPLFPVSRVYTFKLASDLGISGDRAALILPYRHHRVGTFRPLEIGSVAQPINNATVVYGQQAYNAIVEEEEIQVLALS